MKEPAKTDTPWEADLHRTPDSLAQVLAPAVPGVSGQRIIATCQGHGSHERARLIAAAPELADALQGLRAIARMYHKGEHSGHADACEAPDNCGHCLAMRKVDAALKKAGRSS